MRTMGYPIIVRMAAGIMAVMKSGYWLTVKRLLFITRMKREYALLSAETETIILQR